MEARNEVDVRVWMTFVIQNLSDMESNQAQQYLEACWKTESYRALKQKLIEHPEWLSSDELIYFALMRDSEEMPYHLPHQQLARAIEEKREVLSEATLTHLRIIQAIASRDITTLNNDVELTLSLLLTKRWQSSYNTAFLNLAKANLSNLNLTRAPLYGAYLVRADLSHTYMSILTRPYNINMSYANLSGARLDTHFLRKANLYKSNLSQANMEFLQLEDVNLGHANLTEANLTACKLNRVDLRMATLNRTNLACEEFKQTAFFSLDITSLEQIREAFFQLMQAMASCVTTTCTMCDEAGYLEDAFNSKAYLAMVTDLTQLLEAMDHIAPQQRIALLDEMSAYLKPKSKASTLGIGMGNDIGWAQFFGLAEPRTQSQEILHAARCRIANQRMEIDQQIDDDQEMEVDRSMEIDPEEGAHCRLQ
jgi:uncharacterized protein YjbI with pentapeptide repeats